MTTDDLILIEKLRKEDPEQFNTLVRMHLSFNLDLNADECDSSSDRKPKIIKWNLFNKRVKGNLKCSSDVLLSSHTIHQVHLLIEFLKLENNIVQEGVFRRSGKLTRQQELKSLLHQGATLDLCESHFSVHDCASVLKNFLSELPESVLTDAHYPAYLQIAENLNSNCVVNEKRLLETLQLLFLLLPIENRSFVQDIIQLLHLAASYEFKNKMSADNLATLFTPHLLCPKKLSPEAFHSNSQIMSKVVAFMIKKGEELFKVPESLGQDVKAYWDKKDKRKLSPLKQLNESVCDGTAANTIFTFVDRQKTAQANGVNPTETALAELYAHIQSLPESSKKRKLIKQFNKENGCGTPLHKKDVRRGSLGDSIKKHLPVFNKSSRYNQFHEKTSLPQVFEEKPSEETGTEKKSRKSSERVDRDKTDDKDDSLERKGNKRSSPTLHVDRDDDDDRFFTKTPRLTDDIHLRHNFNETMMTPRSRKPVVSLSGTDLCDLATVVHSDKSSSLSKTSADSLSSEFRDYLYSRSILTASPVDLSFSSMTDDYGSTREDEEDESESSNCNEENINELQMTDSLLFCLDGNNPNALSRNDQDWNKNIFQLTDNISQHVHETAL